MFPVLGVAMFSYALLVLYEISLGLSSRLTLESMAFMARISIGLGLRLGRTLFDEGSQRTDERKLALAVW